MKIAIVVLNYNGLKNTQDCLASIKDLEKEGHQLQVIVVDNSSTDRSAQKLSKIKDIIFIRNNQNLGYSGGNNIGIKRALKLGADYILILNNDTIVDKLLLLKLANAAKSGDVISPKIYFAPGFEFHKTRYQKKDLGRVIWYAGANIDWQNIIGVHIGVDQVDRGRFSKRREINLATGACMFVNRRVFDRIGFFDEKYFLYLEDMDFCVRAKKEGFKIIFEPEAVIWHKNAATAGGSGSTLQDYFITRNRLLFASKFAKLKTKIALLRQVTSQLASPIKRRALFDFLMRRFGKGSLKI